MSTFTPSPHIYSKPDDGSGSEQTVIENPEKAEFPNSISPDGHYLVYSCYAMSDPGHIYGIWALL
jgi:hypothetical protein